MQSRWRIASASYSLCGANVARSWLAQTCGPHDTSIFPVKNHISPSLATLQTGWALLSKIFVTLLLQPTDSRQLSLGTESDANYDIMARKPALQPASQQQTCRRSVPSGHQRLEHKHFQITKMNKPGSVCQMPQLTV